MNTKESIFNWFSNKPPAKPIAPNVKLEKQHPTSNLDKLDPRKFRPIFFNLLKTTFGYTVKDPVEYWKLVTGDYDYTKYTDLKADTFLYDKFNNTEWFDFITDSLFNSCVKSNVSVLDHGGYEFLNGYTPFPKQIGVKVEKFLEAVWKVDDDIYRLKGNVLALMYCNYLLPNITCVYVPLKECGDELPYGIVKKAIVPRTLPKLNKFIELRHNGPVDPYIGNVDIVPVEKAYENMFPTFEYNDFKDLNSYFERFKKEGISL